MLTPEEFERYDRQLRIMQIGEEGQERLKKARVSIIGAGGLGSIVSIYLAAAGVGMIRLADIGHVERSNLNRQILYEERDIGRRKAGLN